LRVELVDAVASLPAICRRIFDGVISGLALLTMQLSLELTALHQTAEIFSTNLLFFSSVYTHRSRNRSEIDLLNLTDLTVRSRQEAVEKLSRYALRWKIGVSRPSIRS